MVDDDSAHAAADAEQAAYFRRSLDAERQQLVDGILERQPLIDRSADSTRQLSTVYQAQAEVRYLDRLIDRLDSRFGSHLPDGD